MRCFVGLLATLVCITTVEAAPRLGPAKVQHRIRGATQMFVAPWGLAAQGSGQLRILPLGKTRWQVVHHVKGDSLYRIAHDDAGRLLAWWEKEPYFHLFVPATKEHHTFPLPKPPGPEFKYDFGIEDMYFAPDGNAAIVYMHGFLGGRTWETVAYHIELKAGTPTLLFRQTGHPLHTSVHGTVRAVPKVKDEMCEHTACTLGTIVAWEITGAKATRRVLLDGATRREFLTRVQPVGSDDGPHVAVIVTEHPGKRHLLRWRRGDAKATFTPLAPGPSSSFFDAETTYITRSGDVVDLWLTDDRGLEIRRHPLKGKTTVTSLAPLPRRTPRDRPLFHLAEVMERDNGDLFVVWGEYLLLVPPSGSARRLDLRSVFGRKSEFSGRLLHVRSPEGVWVGLESGKNTDFTFLTQAELEARLSPAP